MALTVTFERMDRWGKCKVVTFKAVDDGSGGILDVSPYLNHIDNVIVTDITTAVFVSSIWTDDSETITIGSEATASDVLKITVIGV